MHINSNKHTILVPLQTTILITTETLGVKCDAYYKVIKQNILNNL